MGQQDMNANYNNYNTIAKNDIFNKNQENNDYYDNFYA